MTEGAAWTQLATHLKDRRAEGRCECTGVCGTPHPGGRCSLRLGGAYRGPRDKRVSRPVTLWATRVCGGEKQCMNPEHVLVLCLGCRTDVQQKKTAPPVPGACTLYQRGAA